MSEHNNVYQLRTPGHVLRQLQEWMLSQHLRPGDRLPAERELARSLSVVRSQLREALRALESIGVLYGHATDGMFVTSAPESELDKLLRLHLSRSGFSGSELISLRIDLECTSAARAARLAAPADLDKLRYLVEAMQQPGINHTRFRELDCEFHLGLANAAHNDLATTLLGSLETSVKHEMSAGYANSVDWTSTALQLAGEHQRILTAVIQGNTTQAVDSLAHHLTAFYDREAS